MRSKESAGVSICECGQARRSCNECASVYIQWARNDKTVGLAICVQLRYRFQDSLIAKQASTSNIATMKEMVVVNRTSGAEVRASDAEGWCFALVSDLTGAHPPSQRVTVAQGNC